MSIRKICRYGEPVLREKCRPVEEITPDIKKLVADMFETLYSAPGVGLAASQVGVPLRICVMDPLEEGRRQPMALINPRIVEKEGTIEAEEGCLSLPGLAADVKRYAKVKVEAVNEKGMPVVVVGENNLLCCCLQHEIDHLDGKIYIDHLSWWKRKKLEGEIRKRKKEGNW
jgi:peptide deformylase